MKFSLRFSTSAIVVFTNSTEIKLNSLLEDILSNEALNSSAKLLLGGTLEVARNSSIYWTKAITDEKNPYHQFFVNKSTLSRTIMPFSDCVSRIDINMYAISFNTYHNGGYTVIDANESATQDASYQSGLAGMSGGAYSN